MQTISVVVVDPHPLARAGLKALLEQKDPSLGAQFVVVGETAYADDLHTIVQQSQPRLILSETDILLRGNPDTHGDVFHMLNNVVDTKKTQIIFYTGKMDNSLIARAQKIGASGYLLKDHPWKESFADIALAVLFGRVRKGSPMEQSLVKRKKSYDDDIPLTNKEVEVLRHVAKGQTNREIARLLERSIETVKEHIANILRKLGAADRTEAAVWAVKKGLV